MALTEPLALSCGPGGGPHGCGLFADPSANALNLDSGTQMKCRKKNAALLCTFGLKAEIVKNGAEVFMDQPTF
jgi:hypothetical protein